MSVEVGWSQDPNAKVNWAGGPVSGVIVPDRRTGMRLVAATRSAGPAAEQGAGCKIGQRGHAERPSPLRLQPGSAWLQSR